jgi:hypothetical protein
VSFIEFSKNLPEGTSRSGKLTIRITSVRISGVSIVYVIKDNSPVVAMNHAITKIMKIYEFLLKFITTFAYFGITDYNYTLYSHVI